MKKQRINVMALAAILFAVSGAFATKIHAANEAKLQTSYYWFNASGVYQTLNTTSAEESRTGCLRSASGCENGYSSDQLINPSQPSQGVKSNQTPKETLHQ